MQQQRGFRFRPARARDCGRTTIPIFSARSGGIDGDLRFVVDGGKPSAKKKSLACLPSLCVTVCNIMTSNTHDPAELGELERDILSIVWRLGTVTAEQAREELNRPLKDSTIRTVLRRLEEKGYLTH